MIKYRLYYSNGDVEIRVFESTEKAQWYIHMQGDHLTKVEKCLP